MTDLGGGGGRGAYHRTAAPAPRAYMYDTFVARLRWRAMLWNRREAESPEKVARMIPRDVILGPCDSPESD